MKNIALVLTILVGKESINRWQIPRLLCNDDTFRSYTPQKFIIEPARHGEKKHIKSCLNKLWIFR